MNIGSHHSEETLKKFFIGKKHTAESNEKNRLAHLGTKYALGHKVSENVRKILSEKNKGKRSSIKTEFKKGMKSWNTGMKGTIKYPNRKSPPPFSSEHRKKIGKLIGNKNPAWKGGIKLENLKIRHSLEMVLWREAVFARDNWTCQKTGVKGGRLQAHHVQNFSQFPELRFAIDNGITLSQKAHRDFHKKYGVKNNNKEQILKFIKNK